MANVTILIRWYIRPMMEHGPTLMAFTITKLKSLVMYMLHWRQMGSILMDWWLPHTHVGPCSLSPLISPQAYAFKVRTYSCHWYFYTRGVIWVCTWSLWLMNWLVLGRKEYGHMTEQQRQASRYTFGTTTPCMISWPMGYFVPGVFTWSSHAQYARNVWGSFGCRRVASIRHSTNIINSSLLTIHSDKTSKTLRKVL